MKILLTGYSGFVGKSILKYLGYSGLWFGIGRSKSKYYKLVKSYHWGQLSEAMSIPDLDIIIHTAGIAHDTSNSTAEDLYFKVNTHLTERIYKEFRESSAHTMIYFSSVKAVSDGANEVIDEQTLPNPKTPYGQSKYCAEKILMGNIPKGKRVIILRPCMIHGPGNKGNLNLLYKFIKKGVPYPLAAFENRRSFLSVSNLIFVIRRIMISPKMESGIYHVADDETFSTTELVGLVASLNGRKIWLMKFPVGFIWVLAKFGDRLKLPLNSDRLKKLTENYVVSNEKIKRSLGLDKMPVSAHTGLEITIKSFNQ